MSSDEPRSQIVYDDPGSVTDIRKRFGQIKGESAAQFRYFYYYATCDLVRREIVLSGINWRFGLIVFVIKRNYRDIKKTMIAGNNFGD